MCDWQKDPDGLTADVLKLAQIALRFGLVERLTRHEDGVCLESDTTHTTMLGLVAASLAHGYYPRLKIGLITSYALVHDLPEVFAGDTPTLSISDDERAAKHAREAKALDQLYTELVFIPWAPGVVTSYERQAQPEARFVYCVDKILPKLTHLLNKGAVLRAEGETRESMVLNYKRQADKLAPYFNEFPILGGLYTSLSEAVLGLEDL